MTWTAPPILPVGHVVTAADWNVLADNLAVFEQPDSGFGIWAAAGAINNGPPPDTGAPVYYVQANSQSGLSVPSNGNVTFTLPTAFPHGLLTAWAMPEGGTSYTGIQVASSGSNKSQLSLWFNPAAAGTGNMAWGAVGW